MLVRNPRVDRSILYLAANAFMFFWIYMAWRGKSSLVMTYIIIGSIVSVSAFALDRFSYWVFDQAGIESQLNTELRAALFLLSSIFFTISYRGIRIWHGKFKKILLYLFIAGIGLSLALIWLPLGLTALALGYLLPKRRMALASASLIWVIYVFEFLSTRVEFIPNFYLFESLKQAIQLLPPWIHLIAWLQVPYALTPKIWVISWRNRKIIKNGWELFSESRIGKVGLVLVVSMILMGIFAPIIAPYRYDDWVGDILSPPTSRHILGTNHYGQDLLSRLIWGSRISLIVGFTAASLSILIGTLIGMISGYYGGTMDTILMRITDVFISIPTLPLMLVLVSLFGKGLGNIILALVLLGWTGTARTVRSQTLSLRERPLTEAAKAIGASDFHILTRHILPNVLPLVLATMIIRVVDAILSEAGLSFLGFGVPFGPPSWGIILHFADRKGAITRGMWWWFLPPGIMIMLLVLGFSFINHAIDQIINPRLRRRR